MQNMKMALIVGQGEVNQSLLNDMAPSWPLIALDGAAHMMREKGLSPDIIIGDFDSFDPASYGTENGAAIKISEQDTNDFEKALYHLKPEMLVGFGLFGKRFDQAMANLHVMAKYHDVTKIIAVTNDEVITVHKGRTCLPAVEDALFAIIPLAPMRFHASHGLAYELDGLSLGFGACVSSSNQARTPFIDLVPEADDEDVFYACCRPLSLIERDGLDGDGLSGLFA